MTRQIIPPGRGEMVRENGSRTLRTGGQCFHNGSRAVTIRQKRKAPENRAGRG